jgi:hypothetical protein
MVPVWRWARSRQVATSGETNESVLMVVGSGRAVIGGSCSDLAAVGDDHLLLRLAPLRAQLLDLLHHLQAFCHLAEHHMLPVQVRGDHRRDEELRAVRVRARVRHRQQTGLSVLELEVFVGKLLSINALAAGAVPFSEIATLKHEARNHTVETASFVAETFLSSTESTEIFNCFRNSFDV